MCPVLSFASNYLESRIIQDVGSRRNLATPTVFKNFQHNGKVFMLSVYLPSVCLCSNSHKESRNIMGWMYAISV